MIFNNETIPQMDHDRREVILRPVGFPPYKYSAEKIGTDHASYFLIRDYIADAAYRYFMDLIDLEYPRVHEMYYEQSGHSRAYELSPLMVYKCANQIASDYHASISNDELEIYAMNIELTNRTDKGLDGFSFTKLVVRSLVSLG